MLKYPNNAIREVLDSRLPIEGYDLVDLVTVNSSPDHLEQILKNFENNEDGLIHYLVQVRPKGQKPRIKEASPKEPEAEIYTSDGSLNCSYLLENGNILIRAGDFSLAKNIFATLVKQKYQPADSLYGLSICLKNLGQPDEAQKRLEESIAYHPELRTFIALMDLLGEKKSFQYEAEVAERALYLDTLTAKEVANLHLRAGDAYSKCDQITKAVSHYQKGLQIDPQHSEILLHLASHYLKEGKHEQAAPIFEQAITVNPTAKAWFGIAICQMSAGNKDDAISSFTESLELELHNPTAIYYLTRLAYETKNYRDAERMVSSYVEVAPINANLLYSLAGLQFHLGYRRKAQATLDKLKQVEPEHKGAKKLEELINKPEEPTP